MDAELAQAIAQSSFLSLLPADDLKRLWGYSETRRVDGDALLFHSGDPAEHFCLVVTGSVGLYSRETPDRETLLDVLVAGDLAGEEAVFDRGVHASTARALSPSRVLIVGASAFFTHLDDRFDIVLALLAGASARLRGSIHEITELKLRSTTRRLANFLISLAGSGKEGAVQIVLPSGKHQLAARLGMKPESLSRAFAKLRSFGVTSGRGDDVLVKDIGALHRYCRSSDFTPDA